MDLVEEFVDATAQLGPSEPFRRWGGMLLTSCLLGRHVRTSIMAGRPLYPNLFVVLVAQSGYGKSLTIGAVRSALAPFARPAQSGVTPQVAMCSTEISAAYVLHALGEAFPDPSGKKGKRAACFAALADEVVVFFGERITAYQVGNLTKLWDCENMIYSRQTVTGAREKDTPSAWSPYMTAVWGCQPVWLTSGFPPYAFGLGLPARMMFVLSEQPLPMDVDFDASPDQDALDAMVEPLWPTMQRVARASGHFRWDKAAAGAMREWTVARRPRRDGGVEWPGDILGPYGERRGQHLGKLALLTACARNPADNLIRLADFESARELLWQCDDDLPRVLQVVGANPDLAKENEVVALVRAAGEMPETEVRAQLRLRARSTFMVKGQLEELIASGQLIEVEPGRKSVPHRRFRAGA